jgi:hypothetical protein
VNRTSKVTNATSLLELQRILHNEDITLRVDFVNSAGAWRCTVGRTGGTKTWAGIGRTVGEAMQCALVAYDTEAT